MSLSFKTPKTALNVTTRDIQNIGGGDCPEINLESTSVEYTENGEYSVTPSEGFDGLSEVGITVNIDTQANLETGTFEIETIGTTTFTPEEADGYSSVEITVPIAPIGSGNFPFQDIQTVLDTDFEEGYFEVPIESGRINETTGYYDAVPEDGMADGAVFHIKPYFVNPDFDPDHPDPEVPEYIFPEDFDLAGKDIVVFFNKANINTIYDRETLVGVDFNDCDLYTVDYNSNPDSWPFGTLRVTENGTVNPTGYAEIEVDVQPALQTKSVTPSDRQQVITPDRDYDGLSEVTVSGISAATKSVTYTSNGTYSIIPDTTDYLSGVDVTVNISGSNTRGTLDNPYDSSELQGMTIPSTPIYVKFTINDDPTPIEDPDTAATIGYRIDDTNNSGYYIDVYPQGGVESHYDEEVGDDLWTAAAVFPEGFTFDSYYYDSELMVISSADVNGNVISLRQTSTDWQTANKQGLVLHNGAFKYSNDSVNVIPNWPVDVNTTVTSNGRRTITASFPYHNMRRASVNVNVPAPVVRTNYFTVTNMDEENSHRLYWIATSSANAGKTLYYSLDDGTTWSSISSEYNAGEYYNTYIEIPNAGNVLIRGLNDSLYGSKFYTTGDNAYFEISGDARSLLFYADFKDTQLGSANVNCFRNLFAGCKGITSFNATLPNNVVEGCYNGMFNGCTNLEVGPALPAEQLVPNCYAGMYTNCSNLVSITCNAVNMTATNCTNNWVSGVQSGGTFFANVDAVWPTGDSGVPSDWTIETI